MKDVASFIPGFLGALASLIGKISLSTDSSIIVLASTTCNSTQFEYCDQMVLFARALGLAAMVYANILMAVYLLRALEKSDSVSVTVISSASNLVFSGVFGYLFLNENIGFNWIVGSILICFGVILVL